jgi:Rnl2 family RNA ligase
MKFKKYPSLTNHYAIGKAGQFDLTQEYVSTEKIHGANISIVIDNQNNIDVAKRTSFLTDEEKTQKPWNTLAEFVNTNKELVLTWANHIRHIATNLTTAFIEQIHLYGELYGSKVQNMQYNENKEQIRKIRFFDIHVVLDNGLILVLSQQDMTDIFGAEYTVPVLRRNTLGTLIATAVELPSELGGHSEGEVYKPAERYILPSEYLTYPVIKHKNESFQEKKQTKKPKTIVEHTQEEIKVLEEVQSRITTQRLLNILSHGDIPAEPKSTGTIIKAFMEDIINEIKHEEPTLAIENHRQLVGKQGGQIAKLFREYLQTL